jgi:urease accessory protein
MDDEPGGAPERHPPAAAPAAGEQPDLALLRLFHLVSPALPVGAYAYSQGLEFAVQAGWVHDEASAHEWLRGIAERGVATLDLPVLLRLIRAWGRGDAAGVVHWNERLLAARETAELRAEDRHLGQALVRILAGLGVEQARRWHNTAASFAAAFALAAVHWGVTTRAALAGYLWTWSENQVLAAVKLVPLGQSAGQRLLYRLVEAMPAMVERALAARDGEIGSAAVAQALASALHETQYTRLFRS